MPDNLLVKVTRTCTIALLTIASIAPQAAAQKKFVAATNETVYLDYEEGFGSTPVQIAWIHNLSSVPIVVYSLTLRDCENVRGSCSPQKVNIKIPPGGRRSVKRVEPRNSDASFRFSMSYGWKADSSDAEALRFLALEGRSRSAGEQLEVRESAIAERRATVGQHDEWLDPKRLAELGEQLASVYTEPDSVVIRVGQQFVINKVRVMARSADGELLGRVGAYNWRVQRSIIDLNADTLIARAPGRVEVEFQLVPPAAARTAKLAVVITADSSRIPERR